MKIFISLIILSIVMTSDASAMSRASEGVETFGAMPLNTSIGKNQRKVYLGMTGLSYERKPSISLNSSERYTPNDFSNLRLYLSVPFEERFYFSICAAVEDVGLVIEYDLMRFDNAKVAIGLAMGGDRWTVTNFGAQMTGIISLQSVRLFSIRIGISPLATVQYERGRTRLFVKDFNSAYTGTNDLLVSESTINILAGVEFKFLTDSRIDIKMGVMLGHSNLASSHLKSSDYPADYKRDDGLVKQVYMAIGF